MTKRGSFIPALRFRVLTPAYDATVRLTTREGVVKRALLAAANLDRATRLLDVGCGTGTFTVEAKRRYPMLEVSGIDPDPAVLTRARKKARLAGVHVTFLNGSATEIPARDGAFDRVTSPLVFHHLTSDQKHRAAIEINRLLELLSSGGLIDVIQHRRFATPAGTVGLISARPATANP